MNIADILRKLADALQSEEQPEAPSCGCGGMTDDEAAVAPEMAPQDEPAAPEGDEAAWMPPQTQEMELLKKLADEPSEFDDGEGDDDMDRLKKLAGITIAKQ